MSREARSVVAVERGGTFPLSFAQQRLWLIDQLEPVSWTYNVSVVRRLRGGLRVDVLRRALDEVVARHEVLRTTYPAVDGQPVQTIGAPAPCELRVVDLSPRPHAEAEARRRVRAEVRRRFDLAAGPLFRALLIRLGDDGWILVLTMHHIATDAWSEALLLRELSVLYNAFARSAASPLAPVPIQYADFASWQRTPPPGALDRHLDYWVNRLAGLPPLLEVTGDRPRPARRSGRGARVDFALPAPLVDGLRRVANAGRATLFMTVLAAFQVLLARYTGEDDIVVGAPIANRTRLETNEILGFFANTLVLRTDLSGDPSFVDALARVRETALGAYCHQDVPFERVVQALAPVRSLGHTSLFQHMFVFQNAPEHDLRLDGLSVEELVVDSGTAMFDLTLQLRESGDALDGWLEYSTDLYDRATAERLVEHFTTLLEAIVAEPTARIGGYDLLDALERQRMLTEWNATSGPFPDRCVHELFAAVAREQPDAIALTADDGSLTYRELDERANRLAAYLLGLGVRAEARVGVHLPRSAEAVVAVLATLKAGGAYVPLDPEYPAARLEFMIDDAAIEVVLSRSDLAAGLAGCGARVVCLDVDQARIAALPPGEPEATASPDALAYVMYTSGSTGMPKGVMTEHRAVVALLFGVDYFRFDEVGALLHMAPLAFDAATFEIWGALLHGRRCVVAPDEPFSLARFGAYMREQRVDALWLTAALFNLIVDEGWRCLAGARQLVVGGDALSPAHVKKALRLLPGVRLVNGYGPTEATTFAACHVIRPTDAEGTTIPIGRPIANTQLYVVDANLQPVPIGVVGELLIGGVGLARGYLRRPDLTAERFVPHPYDPDRGARVYRTGDRVRSRPDGLLEFVGRVDDQVKIRGFRVETGEVAAALRQHPAVSAAAVVACEGERGKQLVAYVVAPGTSGRELRDHLRARVPAHALPTGIVLLDELPMTGRGKLDRAALPACGAAPDTVPQSEAMTPTERAQVALWCEILGLEHVGVDDNFFALGGDSLLAAVLLARTARQTGRDIPLSLMFSGPTIREIVTAIERDNRDVRDDATIVPLQPVGTKPALVVGHTVGGSLFQYMELVRHLDQDQPVFGLRPTPSVLGHRRRRRLEDLARRYRDDILRLQPNGPYCLAGFCFGGIVMLEVAHQLEVLGHTVAVLALFDAEPTSVVRESRPRREAAQLAALLRREETIATYLRRRIENARTMVEARPNLLDSLRMRVRSAGRGARDEPVWSLERSLARALKSYVVPATACPVTLFLAGDPSTPTTGVRFVPGHDDTYIIDGPGVCHDTLMDEPHVAALAAALTEVLERAGTAAPLESAARPNAGSDAVGAPNGDRDVRGRDGERGGVPVVDIESM